MDRTNLTVVVVTNSISHLVMWRRSGVEGHNSHACFHGKLQWWISMWTLSVTTWM